MFVANFMVAEINTKERTLVMRKLLINIYLYNKTYVIGCWVSGLGAWFHRCVNYTVASKNYLEIPWDLYKLVAQNMVRTYEIK